MKSLTKTLLFGASLLTLTGTAFAADQKPQKTTWVEPPAWVMLLGRGDQISHISLDRMVYVDQAINPTAEANVAEVK